MTAPHIALAGIGTNLHGLTWESHHRLRIGRNTQADVVLPDFSVDRAHAEIRHQGIRWILTDLAQNSSYPTLVNHQPVDKKGQTLNIHDVIQVGKVQLKVIVLESGAHPDERGIAEQVAPAPAAPLIVKTTTAQMRLQAATHNSWDQALELATREAPARPEQEKTLLTLVRANHHLTHLSQMNVLLQSILTDAIETLQAQRGSIVLADAVNGELSLKATLAPRLRGPNIVPLSKTLVQRCFHTGESLLFQDIHTEEAVLLARSIRHGAMSSVICAVLRTPSKRLGVLHLDRGMIDDPFTDKDLMCADAIAASVALSIETAQIVEQQRDQFIQTVSTLARAASARDQYSGEHTRRVTDYSLLLADELKLPADEKYQLQLGSCLYDIGKISIDDAILRKPGKLTCGEFETMKTHTVKGASMLDAMASMLPLVPIVRSHHERWDGLGYPDGLTSDQIPLNARIVSVADAFDAMTSDRPYRAALPVNQAFLELIGKAGTHFDPACVYAFVKARAKVESLMEM